MTDAPDPRPAPTTPHQDREPVVSISTDIQDGVGCLFQAVAFAIVLWALYNFSGPFWVFLLK